MIDLKKANGIKTTFYCPDCEQRYGVPIEFTRPKNVSKSAEQALTRFFKHHEHCGENYPDLWTEKANDEFATKKERIRRIYDENPGISFEQVAELYRLRFESKPTGKVEKQVDLTET